jgi:tetratricopeptide (TPR) repeat protein
VYFHRNELDAFTSEAERAIALNPNNAFTLADLGRSLEFAGDERGIALVKKAMKLDPFHPTFYHFAVAHSHFHRGEYEAALAEARKINLPGSWLVPAYLAGIYAELDRHTEARSLLGELLRLRPDSTMEVLTSEARKWNLSDDRIQRWASALRKAGLPE